MSLPAPYIESYYIADGVTTSFAFGQGFTALAEANIKCIIYFGDGTNCVPTFTVNMTTGYINIVTLTKPDGTVLTVPPEGSIVRVFRDTPEQQNVTASQLQNYTAKQLERIFDSIVAMIQENSFTTEHKTVRLTETQRDVSLAVLTELVNDHLLYWDNETSSLQPTDFPRQDIVRCVGGLFFRVRTWQNTSYLQWSLNQVDWNSINISDIQAQIDEIRDIADEAKEIAEDAKEIAEEAKEIAEDANDKSDTAIDYAQQAMDYVSRVSSERYVFTITSGQTALRFDESVEDKEIDLYWNGQLITPSGNWTVSGDTVNLLFEPETDDIIAVIVSAIRQVVNTADLSAHNTNPNAHANMMSAHNTNLSAHTNLISAHNTNLSAHANIVSVINNRIDTVDARIDTANIDCGTLS